MSFSQLNNPLVSVIMTAYNADQFIDKAITSILNQSYRNIELLIVNDASTDNTALVIDKFSDTRIRKFSNVKNLHYLQSVNRMFDHCRGDLITFQDADDWSHPDRIRLQVDEFLKNPSLGGNSVNFYRIDITGENVIMQSDYPVERKEILAYLPQTFKILAGAIMIRREVLLAIGYYNVFFTRVGSEHLYWFYLIIEKYNFINLKEFLYYYRYNTESFTSKDSLTDFSRYIAVDVLEYVISQRMKTGNDCIEKNDLEGVILMMNHIHRKQQFRIRLAHNLSWSGKHNQALKQSLKAIMVNPSLFFSNFRDLLFYIKNMIKN